MTTVSKIVLFFGTIVFFTFICVTTIGEQKKQLTLRYKNDLVQYICKDQTEYNNLVLRDKADILFFDGETPFETVPVNRPEVFLSKIVSVDDVVVGGDMSGREFTATLLFIFLATLFLFGMTLNKL